MLSEEAYGEWLLDCMPPCDPSAPPLEVRVAINSDLVRIVRECGMDLSLVCERGITEQVRLHLLQEWRRLRDDQSRRDAGWNRDVGLDGD